MRKMSRRDFALGAAAGALVSGIPAPFTFLAPSPALADKILDQGFHKFLVGDITMTALYDGLWEKPHDPSFIANATVEQTKGALIVAGYAKLQAMPGKNPQLWYPTTGARHGALLLMWPALILLAAAYIPSNIRTRMRHPMLAAIKLWAVAHLAANGDLAGVLLFASFLAYAIYDRISVKRRAALGPLGEARGGVAGDIAAVAVGSALYAALLFGGHRLLIGKPLLAGF